MSTRPGCVVLQLSFRRVYTGTAHPIHLRRNGTLIEIQLSDDDRLDWALKSFKKKVQKAGILADLRRKRHYTKPSAARQLKAAAARRRRRAAARRG
jgi:small subunit ribosomal protein S21